tara:strand:- start:103 stop:276 length:174 start_codon:yes stop_codon:yes gene_type:complete
MGAALSVGRERIQSRMKFEHGIRLSTPAGWLVRAEFFCILAFLVYGSLQAGPDPFFM